MTRTNAREIVAQLVYEMQFREESAHDVARAHMEPEYFTTLKDEADVYQEKPDARQAAYIESTLCGIEEKREELEGYIRKYAIGWDLKRISRTARAIMLLAMYESLYVDDVPTSAAISEAVELASRYSEPRSSRYINGVLGAMERDKQEG